MPLFGGARDISLFRTMNRELINDIIQTEIAYYKIILDQTVTNVYGESKLEQDKLAYKYIKMYPEINIVEVSDDDNYLSVDEKLQSNNPVLDVAMVVVSKWSVPTIIMAATIGLLGVAGLMMVSRRKEALDRVAEQSSLLQGLDEETRF